MSTCWIGLGRCVLDTQFPCSGHNGGTEFYRAIQDAGDVEFVVHSDAPAEAPQSAAAHLTAADSAAANAIPAAEKGQTSPMEEASPITPPQIQINRLVPSSRSSTAGSDNGDIPVTFTANRLGHVTSQDSYERGTFRNGVATPAFQDSYGASRQVAESSGREDPWVSMSLSCCS